MMSCCCRRLIAFSGLGKHAMMSTNGHVTYYLQDMNRGPSHIGSGRLAMHCTCRAAPTTKHAPPRMLGPLLPSLWYDLGNIDDPRAAQSYLQSQLGPQSVLIPDKTHAWMTQGKWVSLVRVMPTNTPRDTQPETEDL